MPQDNFSGGRKINILNISVVLPTGFPSFHFVSFLYVFIFSFLFFFVSFLFSLFCFRFFAFRFFSVSFRNFSPCFLFFFFFFPCFFRFFSFFSFFSLQVPLLFPPPITECIKTLELIISRELYHMLPAPFDKGNNATNTLTIYGDLHVQIIWQCPVQPSSSIIERYLFVSCESVQPRLFNIKGR